MNTEKLPPDFKKKWVEALRSGEFKQEQGSMYCSERDAYCCLGVAARLYNVNLLEGDPYEKLPNAINGGFSNPVARHLITMNDGDIGKRAHSFNEIADWIEENL